MALHRRRAEEPAAAPKSRGALTTLSCCIDPMIRYFSSLGVSCDTVVATHLCRRYAARRATLSERKLQGQFVTGSEDLILKGAFAGCRS
jgi:hypothetical protein